MQIDGAQTLKKVVKCKKVAFRAGAAGARAGAVSASLMLKGGLLALMPLMVQSMDVAVVGQSTTSALRLMSLAAVQESL